VRTESRYIRNFDYLMLLSALALVAFGIIPIYSGISQVRARRALWAPVAGKSFSGDRSCGDVLLRAYIACSATSLILR
jgi:cell division protein FtsW (lipid II flippase)